MRNIILQGHGFDDIRRITVGQGTVSTQRIRIAIQVINGTAFKLSAGPLSDFISRTVVHFKTAAAPSHLDTRPAQNDFVAIDPLVCIPHDKQVVFRLCYRRTNQLKGSAADILGLINNHRANSKRWFLRAQELACLSECLLRLTKIRCLQLSTILSEHGPQCFTHGPPQLPPSPYPARSHVVVSGFTALRQDHAFVLGPHELRG
ncbi:hypothetical protein D9M70_415700 [compost metagenome]